MTPNDRLRAEAERFVDSLVADLNDRRGLKSEWRRIDADIQQEIRNAWREMFIAFAHRAVDEALADLQGWCARCADPETVHEIARRRKEMEK